MSDDPVLHPTRFRKGQSGNPKGRPRKQPATRTSAFDVVIERTLTITQNGQPREVTVDEALQHKTYLDAISGNRAARREVLKMIAKREKAITKKKVGDNDRPAALWDWVQEGPDPANADEALLILGIACRDPHGNSVSAGGRDHLLLEPWAVGAALARRAARRLEKHEIVDARRCTRDAHTLNWPDPIEP